MSITEVAQAANVSYATAWRIINKQPGNSEQAIAAVREAMGQLGFDPAVATRKRGRRPRSADGIRTRNIALLHLRATTSISRSVLSYVQRLLGQNGLNLIFAHCESVTELPQAVRSGNIDGLLGYGHFPSNVVDARLKKIPAVWMMSRPDTDPDPWGDRVKPDHQAIGSIAARYLLERGHRSVGYLNPDLGVPIYRDRLRAFCAACEDQGVKAQVFSSAGTTDFNEEADRLVAQWMAADPRATAIFVPVDRVTLRVYRQLERRGIVPGRDVDVVSCDNEVELLSLMHPPPPSIDLNRQTIARLAVERLLWRMKNGFSSPSTVTTVSPTLSGPSPTFDDRAVPSSLHHSPSCASASYEY